MTAAFDVGEHTIFVGLAGSRAQGLARPESDLDVRGVAIAPLPIRISPFARFEQYEGPLDGELRRKVLPALARRPALPVDARAEAVVFDVAKLIALAAVQNPGALELLFTDEGDWLLETAAWRRIHAARHRFVTRRVESTFLGYAMQQLHRIETHRSWLLSPPAGPPRRADFGLPEASTLSADDRDRLEAAITRKTDEYGLGTVEMPAASRLALEERLDRLLADLLGAPPGALDERTRAVATSALGLPVEVVQALNGERRYRAAQKSWDAFRAWQERRNPARAELERRFGYDTKHAMHLVRSMRMGIEALRTGEIVVRRPDADELRAIRDGALSYEALRQRADALRSEMRDAASGSRLPETLDPAEAEVLLVELVVG